MSCKAIIQVSEYDPEEKKQVAVPIEIGTVEENESFSLEDVVNLIINSRDLDRGLLADRLVNTRKQNISLDMWKSHQFASNTTVGDLAKYYPSLEGVFTPDPNLNNQYTIIRINSGRINGVEYGGRVITSKGKEIFIINNIDTARDFFAYAKIKEAAQRAFGEGGVIPEGIDPSLLNDVDLIVNKKSIAGGRLGAIMTFLNNRKSLDTITVTVEGKGRRVINVDRTLERLANNLIQKDDYNEKYTDFEAMIKKEADITKNNKGVEEWTLTKVQLYKAIELYYPETLVRVSSDGTVTPLTQEEFNDLSLEEMQELLTGREDSSFMGQPKLQRSVVARIKQGTRTENDITKKPTEKKVSQDKMQEIWKDQILPKIGRSDLPEEYSKLLNSKKITTEQIVEIINNGKFTATIDGEERELFAEVGKKNPSIHYIVPASITKKVTESKSKVTLKFPNLNIGSIYHFGYDQEKYIFSPVNEEGQDVVNGKYKGMYIYRATVNGKPVYVISRSVISPNAQIQSFPTLDAAKKGVERKFNNDIIIRNSLLSIKQQGRDAIPRSTNLEIDNVQDGQVISILDLDLPLVEIRNLMGVFQQMFQLTTPKLQEQFAGIVGDEIQKIDTPEKAAALILLVANSITVDEASDFEHVHGFADLQKVLKRKQYKERIAEIINTIDTAPTRHYWVEKLKVYEQPGGYLKYKKEATLKLLKNGTDTLTVEGTHVGEAKINDFLYQNLNTAIGFINKTEGINVKSVTTTEIAGMKALDQNGNETDTPLIKGDPSAIRGFIYRGEIYINTSTAKIDDLYHEVSHLFLGVMKVKYPERYTALLEQYRKNRTFNGKLTQMSKSSVYKGLAQQDLYEEAVVRIMADEMMRDGKLSVSEGAEYGERFNNLMNTLVGFTKDDIKNGLGFDAFMETLTTKNSEENIANKVSRNRMLTNFVQQMILQNEITEDCK